MLFSLLIRLFVLPLATRRMNFGALTGYGADVAARITVEVVVLAQRALACPFPVPEISVLERKSLATLRPVQVLPA